MVFPRAMVRRRWEMNSGEEEVGDEQKGLHRACRGWELQQHSHGRESPQAANSLPQSVFHLSASFSGLIYQQLLASTLSFSFPSPAL